MTQTGILIIAGGHKNYGHLACNLIYSIRAHSDIPIHVLWHGDAYSTLPHDLITCSEIPEEARTKNGVTNYFKTKTCIYDLTPFDNTLFFDADIVLFGKSVDDLVTDLINIEWTIQNRARVSLKEDYSLPNKRKQAYLWGDINEVKEKFPDAEFLYSLHSECMWFKKSEDNRMYFDLVKEYYQNPPIKPSLFAGDVADELAFGLACITLDKRPHIEPFKPVYWWQLDGKTDGFQLGNLNDKYYGYSAGGNAYNGKQVVADNYNILAENAAKVFGQRAFRLVPKRDYLKERKNM